MQTYTPKDDFNCKDNNKKDTLKCKGRVSANLTAKMTS